MLKWLSSKPVKRKLPFGSPKVDVSLETIRDWNVNHYFLHYDTPRNLLGGYELDIFGDTGGDYDFDGETISHPGLRVHLNIKSDDDRTEWPDGALGICTIHNEYVEARLALEPDHTRDILSELRFDGSRSFRIAGPAIDTKRFWATMLMLSAPDEK